MKKNVILLLCFLLTFFLSVNSFAQEQQERIDIQNCFYFEPGDENNSELRNYSPFNGSATPLSLNHQSGNAFQYAGQKKYFRFSNNIVKNQGRRFVKLNYSGYNASLKIYNANYYNSSDFLFYSSNINNDIDIMFCEYKQDYILEFQSITPGLWTMLLTLEIVSTSNLSNYDKYIMHLDYNSNSFFGFTYDIEYYDLSTTSATNTSSYCNYIGYGSTYLDLIGNNIASFGISNDNRRMATDSRKADYSAIAYEVNEFQCDNTNNLNYYSSSGNGSASFVDSSTVVGCAHGFCYYDSHIYNEDEINEDPYQGLYGMASSASFYPGANSYQNSNLSEYFGEYKATHTFLPVAYILFMYYPFTSMMYDWSISLTTNTEQGLYTHSYMGLCSTYFNGVSYIHSAGYPTPTSINSGNSTYAKGLWVTYPLENEIILDNSYFFESDTIVVSKGNSGGPLYRYIESWYNGNYSYGSAMIVAICSSYYIPNGVFEYSYFSKITPFLINLYREVI